MHKNLERRPEAYVVKNERRHTSTSHNGTAVFRNAVHSFSPVHHSVDSLEYMVWGYDFDHSVGNIMKKDGMIGEKKCF